MISGCLLFNKNPGITSFQSLGIVKKAFATGKVCHTGTLDKFAGGLLIILVGQAVKLASRFTGCDKRYRARVLFGEETDTLDPEGRVIASAPLPERPALEALLPSFTGEIMQAPPLYSAIHVNGVRAHKLARSSAADGISAADGTIEMKKRPITIYSLKITQWVPPCAELEVHCSSGTYIRSLARDLALAAGSRARLESLTRNAVGNFSLTEAITVANTAEDSRRASGTASFDRSGSPPEADLERLRQAIIPLSPALFARLGIPSLAIEGRQARSVSYGSGLQFLQTSAPAAAEALALFSPDGFTALVEKKGGAWTYACVAAEM